MAEETKIQWTDHSWSPWEGCTKVSPGCAHCYASAGNIRWRGGKNWGPGAPRREMSAAHWKEPIKWNKRARDRGVRERVFPSICDPFDGDVPEQWRESLWDLITETQHLDWLLLTKRPQNAVRMLPWGEYGAGPTPWGNVWIGTSVEDQERADERIPHLLRTPAAVRFLSCEPLLGPVELDATPVGDALSECDCRGKGCDACMGLGRIEWVIVGGESGARCRPMAEAWALSLKEQCAAAGVAFFFKQQGGHPDKRDRMEQFPVELRVREFPRGIRQ